MSQDPLSDVLSLLKPRSYVSAGFDAGGDWCVAFTDQQGYLKCYAVVSGGCWLAVDGVETPVRLNGGDCFVLPAGRPFRLASDLSVAPIFAAEVFPRVRRGGIATLQGGGDVYVVGSRFAVSGSHAAMLMRMLPPIMHLKKASDQAAWRWAVERMMHELREQEPGSQLIAQHLAHMMLVQALRLQVAQGQGVGWLHALSDRQMGAAIAAIHAAPGEDWSLDRLAETACMSRSAFAARFKALVGDAPMAYVTRWRMLLASERLEQSTEPVSAIALSLGYQSESAFSTAFKRVMGTPPRRRGRAGAALSDQR